MLKSKSWLDGRTKISGRPYYKSTCGADNYGGNNKPTHWVTHLKINLYEVQRMTIPDLEKVQEVLERIEGWCKVARELFVHLVLGICTPDICRKQLVKLFWLGIFW